MKEIRYMLVLLLALAFVLTACGNGQEQEAASEEPEVTPVAEQVEGSPEADPVEEAEVVEPEMTEEEMTAWVMENCICPQCPSWIPEAAEKGEGGYCAVGMSECIVDEVGCICPDCPVTEEKGLMWGYYCTRGSAQEMMAQEEETP